MLTCFCLAYLGRGQVRPVFDTDSDHKNVTRSFHAQNLERTQCHVRWNFPFRYSTSVTARHIFVTQLSTGREKVSWHNLVPGTTQFRDNLVPGTNQFRDNLVPGTTQFRDNLVPGTTQFRDNLVLGMTQFRGNLFPARHNSWQLSSWHDTISWQLNARHETTSWQLSSWHDSISWQLSSGTAQFVTT